jgi:hypothetical protein
MCQIFGVRLTVSGGQCGMANCIGRADALLVVVGEAAPADYPAEGALHHPAPRDDLETFRLVRAEDDLDGEAEGGALSMS